MINYRSKLKRLSVGRLQPKYSQKIRITKRGRFTWNCNVTGDSAAAVR